MRAVMFHEFYPKILILFCFLLLAAFPVAAENASLTMIHLGSAEGEAIGRVIRRVLSEHLGISVRLESMDANSAYRTVSRGEADVFLEARLPLLHKKYHERYENKVLDCGCVYRGAQSGLVVPAFVDPDRISELNAFKRTFQDSIIGPEAESLIMKTLKDSVMPRYDIDLDLKASDNTGVLSALGAAMDNSKWIVIAASKPHWMFARWDLKFLKQDLDKLIWKPDNIHIIARKDLTAGYAEVVRFLTSLSFYDDELSDLLLAIHQSSGSPSRAVDEWLRNHEKLVQSWLP